MIPPNLSTFDSMTITHKEQDLFFYTFFTLFCLIVFCSLIGNSLVVVVVLLKRDMRSETNFFIAVLAASDFLVAALPLWILSYAYLARKWIFGRQMCYVSHALACLCLYWSPYTLAAMAMERYLMVCQPMKFHITIKRCFLVVIAIWLLSGGIFFPLSQHLEYIEFANSTVVFCHEVWKDWSRLLYGILTLLLRTVIPFLIIAFCHRAIIKKLNEQHMRFLSMRSQESRAHDLTRKRSLQRLLVIMTVIFGVCSFPHDIYNIIHDINVVFEADIIPPRISRFVYPVCYLIAMTGIVLNPVVYAWLNHNFKRELERMASCRKVPDFVLHLTETYQRKSSTRSRNRASPQKRKEMNECLLNDKFLLNKQPSSSLAASELTALTTTSVAGTFHGQVKNEDRRASADGVRNGKERRLGREHSHTIEEA